MSLATTQNRIPYTGDSVTTAFSFPYPFFSQSELVVIVRSADGTTETTKVITTDYTISGTVTAGEFASGGTVTFLSAPATGTKITIYREPVQTQTVNLVDNDPLPALTINQQFDKIVMLIQRNRDINSRAIQLSPGYVASFSPVLPTVLTANAVLTINGTGDGLALGASSSDIAAAAANAAAAAASAASAAAASVTANAAAALALAAAQAAKVTAVYTQFQTAALTASVLGLALPAKTCITHLFVKHSIAFAGTSITSIKLGIGVVGDTGSFIDQFDLMAAVSDTAFEVNGLTYIGSFVSSTNVNFTVTAIGANLTSLTAGSVDLWYRTIQLA